MLYNPTFCINERSSRSAVLERLIVPWLVKNSTQFMDPQLSLPCYQEPASGFKPEPHESSPRPLTLDRH